MVKTLNSSVMQAIMFSYLLRIFHNIPITHFYKIKLYAFRIQFIVQLTFYQFSSVWNQNKPYTFYFSKRNAGSAFADEQTETAYVASIMEALSFITYF